MRVERWRITNDNNQIRISKQKTIMPPELKKAITLIKAGQKQEGKEILLQLLHEDEHNDMAWVWLSATVDTDEMRLECLQEALKINSDNQTAQRGYQKIALRMQRKQEESLEALWEEDATELAPPEQPDDPVSTDEWSYEEYKKTHHEEEDMGGIPAAHHNPLKTSPWLTIWYAPRITVTAVLQSNDPQKHVLLIAAVIGLLGGFSGLFPLVGLGNVYLFSGFVTALILGPLMGIIGLYVSGAILGWLGFFLGGTGSAADVRVALAWAFVPRMTLSILILLQLMLFIFTAPLAEANGTPQVSPLANMIFLLQLPLSLWIFYIYLQCLGAAHRFSAWRALGTLLMPSVVIGFFACILLFLIGITS